MRKLLTHVGAPLVLLLVGAHAIAGDVKEADATCHTATAILLTGDGSDDATRWRTIREVVAKNRAWTVVREAPSNRVGEVALTRFDIKHTFKGGPTVAYTVQCGHGGTCNDVANKFRAEHPNVSPAPVVQCGDLGHMLTNPQPAP